MSYLKKKTAPSSSPSAASTSFDLIIIGGGSGGLSLSSAASALGQRVLLLDYVSPTPLGTKWGIGGTCVNVGCIPKKMMHRAALVGEEIRQAHTQGWMTSSNNGSAIDPSDALPPLAVSHRWSTLVASVQRHIRSLNFGYRSRLSKDANITYANARGRLTSSRTVEATDAKGVVVTYTARKHIVLCVGGHPRYPDIPGARELGITSDDVFSLSTPPGKTLIVGAGYIALESAGFLRGLDVSVDIMVRAKVLRGFDIDIAARIEANMQSKGVNFLRRSQPTRLEKRTDGRIDVHYSTKIDGVDSEQVQVYDTVLFAIGRAPRTDGLGLREAGVNLDKSGGAAHGKVIMQRDEDDAVLRSSLSSSSSSTSALAQFSTSSSSFDPDETSVHGIFALGDVAKGRPELTPIASASAKLLAKRLYDPRYAAAATSVEEARKDDGADGNEDRPPMYSRLQQLLHTPSPSRSSSASSRLPTLLPPAHTIDYSLTPTTVFTPLEYGCVGWSEEVALQRLGADAVEVFHSSYRPLEWATHDHGSEDECYIKIVTRKSESESPLVVGLHFLGPNAGEVLQGFSLAFSLGLTKSNLDDAIGIHPTSAEEMCSVEVTKSSGLNPRRTGC